MNLTLDCRRAARLISLAQDQAPAPVTRARLQLHLLTCRHCRGVDAQVRFLRTAMLTVRRWPGPPDAPTGRQR